MATEADNQEQDFDDTPEGIAKRWTVEFKAARKSVERWHTQGGNVVKRFLDDREGTSDSENSRWNLFWANVITQSAMLYGQTPKISVTRRFADAKDEVARVAAEILERILNGDIQRDGDNCASALELALSDHLLVGFASVRARYVVDTETEDVPAKTDDEGNELAEGYSEDKKTKEDVETDYIHWKDELWSPARTYHDLRWRAWRNEMSKKEIIKRFGSEFKDVPMNAKRASDSSSDDDAQKNTPWARAEVWEIWDKEHKKRLFFVEGYVKILEEMDDPLGLDGFFPSPKPMFTNLSTSKLIPKPDFAMAQDLYNEIDDLSSRICAIEKALRVAGVYDSTAEGVQALLEGGNENKLIPVSNWNMFRDKNDLAGAIDWLPLEAIVATLDKLREYRTELIGTLYQITGMSDIMRGQAAETGVTATEQSLKAKFASVRLQKRQDEFARFASDLQSIRAQIIAKFFDAETILERSNAKYSYDADIAMQAVQLIKSEISCYRIEVKPEAVSMTDFAQLKAERTEFLASVSTFLQAAAPLMQAVPDSMSFLLEMLQWSVAGIRGSSQIEGVLDKAIQQAEMAKQQQAANPQPPPPDPKLQAVQAKAQADLQKTQADLQAHLIGINAETQANFQRQKDQTMWNIKEQQARQHIKGAIQPGPTPAFDATEGGQ
jgi:hypothetical protein